MATREPRPTWEIDEQFVAERELLDAREKEYQERKRAKKRKSEQVKVRKARKKR